MKPIMVTTLTVDLANIITTKYHVSMLQQDVTSLTKQNKYLSHFSFNSFNSCH